MTAPKVDHDVPYPNTAHKFTFGTVLGGMISHLVRSTQPVCTFGMVIQCKELPSPNCCDLVLRFGTMGKKTGSKQKEVAAAVSGKQGPVVATTRTTRRALKATAPPGSSPPEDPVDTAATPKATIKPPVVQFAAIPVAKCGAAAKVVSKVIKVNLKTPKTTLTKVARSSPKINEAIQMLPPDELAPLPPVTYPQKPGRPTIARMKSALEKSRKFKKSSGLAAATATYSV